MRSFRRGSASVLAMGVLLLAAACQSEQAAEPAPADPAELSVEDLVASVADGLAAMASAQFEMIDELESGAKFFGTTFKSMEAEVRSPDRVRMVVDVVAPGLGFAEVEILAVGEQAFMKFSRDAPWLPLPLDQVPFNFGAVGPTLSEVVRNISGPSVTGEETVLDRPTIRLEGQVMSDDLSTLITSADAGHEVTLTLWVEEGDHTLRQLVIAGKLFNDDAPETRRLLIISGVNVPVDIQLPDIASGS